MSLQRAYVNCQRCYGLVKQHDRVLIKERIEDDQFYTARNETMKALETVVQRIDCMLPPNSEISDPDLRSNIHHERSQASSFLDACKGCDYKSPTIADLLDIAEVDKTPPNYNK